MRNLAPTVFMVPRLCLSADLQICTSLYEGPGPRPEPPLLKLCTKPGPHDLTARLSGPRFATLVLKVADGCSWQYQSIELCVAAGSSRRSAANSFSDAAALHRWHNGPTQCPRRWHLRHMPQATDRWYVMVGLSARPQLEPERMKPYLHNRCTTL